MQMRELIAQLFTHKLNRDIAWTFVGFGVLAVTGILMNILIAVFRDASALGVFNIAYAVYLVGSQFAVMGIHYAVMRYSAYHENDATQRGSMLGSAIVLAICLGSIFTCALLVATPLFELMFSEKAIVDSIHHAVLGLSLFPLNKVLIAHINGLRRMKAFAILQSLRYLAVLASVAWVCIGELPFHYAPLSFLAAEMITSICAILYLQRIGSLRGLRVRMWWLKHHLVFGSKAAIGGIFLDMNTRLDVLILGSLLSPRSVGIYSFAAMLVDGVQHILAILRVNFNPVIVASLRDQDYEHTRQLLRQSKRYVTLGTLAVSLAILAAFWLIITYILPEKGYDEAMLSLMVLLSCFTMIAGFAPFDNLLLASGHPFLQTLQTTSITLTNVACCFLLIPTLGILGAAIATSLGYLVGTLLLLMFSYRMLGWNMIRNRFSTT